MKQRHVTDNLAYHAARLLLLIRFCGKPQESIDRPPGILGRTLLAKLDFFLRYPSYLKRARALLRKQPLKKSGILEIPEANSVESRMVRYLYGPWDHIYYPTLAYLIGKGLLTIESARQAEYFRLTAKGMEISNQIAADPAYSNLADRARIVYSLFHSYTGSGIKNFIYQNFPEVVGKNIGEVI